MHGSAAPQWLHSGRAVCELGIRTLRNEIDEYPELGREPLVIEAHTALKLALAALDAIGERPHAARLAEAQAAFSRARDAVAAARGRIDALRQARTG
jgi:hypothetical protein